MPPDFPRYGLGRRRRANFISSPACTFKISRYAATWLRHLTAYEINAQGWKKRLSRGWGGGGEGAVHFKNCYCQGGGGAIFICNYLRGVQFCSFDTPHISENPRRPWDVINVWPLNPLEGDFLLIYKSTFRSHRRKRTTNQRRLKDQKPKTEILEITTTSLR